MKQQQIKNFDVIIIGAGAAGLMCAITAGSRGRSVLVLDHANKVGKKILMSGGGKCNFTNYNIEPENFISHNPHFCKSALSRYTQWDFISLVEKHGIAFHEKTLGQLFCDHKSSEILNLLLAEAKNSSVVIQAKTAIKKIVYNDEKKFSIETAEQLFSAESVVIASGGLSIPTMGATGFAWDIAKQFGLEVYPPVAGLVPFIFNQRHQTRLTDLAGTAVDVEVNCNGQSFKEAMLFTHKGLSGPAILQISSYWNPGDPILINLVPALDAMDWLLDKQQQRPKAALKTILSEIFTKKLSEKICEYVLAVDKETAINQLSEKSLQKITDQLTAWTVYPENTEGYRTAEVTMGGIDTDQISSKTFETKMQPGLYFIGEALDVTGHLGGYNFQWAWSSGYAAGSYV
jgi:hypothetical protein